MPNELSLPPGAPGLKLWFTDQPDLSDGPIDVSDYLSAEKLELEREYIFRNAWLYVGRVTEIPSPNGFITRDINSLRASIIVTRDGNGKLSAFHNVCRHRQKKLVLEREGTAPSFVCSMHGWAYGRDGGLRSIPDEGQFPGIDKSNCGLAKIHVDTWRGFIFVHFSEPEETLREFLGEVADFLDSTPFEDFPLAMGSEWTTDANWKLVRDANMETYHAPHLHRRSTMGTVFNPLNPHNRPIYAKTFKRHRMFSISRGTPVSNVPRHLSKKSVLSRATSFVGLKFDFDPSAPIPVYANPGNGDAWLFDLWFIWPNMTINVRNRQIVTAIHEPITADKSLTRTTTYVPQVGNAQHMFARMAQLLGNQNVISEDAYATEATQIAMLQRAFPDIYLADSEMLIRHAQIVDAAAMEKGAARVVARMAASKGVL